MDMDFIGAPSKKKPKLATPSLEETLSSAAAHTSAKKKKQNDVFFIMTGGNTPVSAASTAVTLGSSAVTSGSSTVISGSSDVISGSSAEPVDSETTTSQKRSKLLNDILEQFPKVTSTGIFFFVTSQIQLLYVKMIVSILSF